MPVRPAPASHVSTRSRGALSSPFPDPELWALAHLCDRLDRKEY